MLPMHVDPSVRSASLPQFGNRLRARLMGECLPIAFVLISILILGQGCTPLAYYSQAVNGHLSLMAKRQSLAVMLRDETLPADLRERLELVVRIRDFASESLGLPDNSSYRSYAEVDGEALVWSIVAAGKTSVAPRQWCYLLIGCASYRGYFHRDAALRQQASLELGGDDVTVEPVPAYSSLGWFDDPVPATVINWVDWRLAGLIFHELAHQRLYLPGDSAFNEAFANQVQRAGVMRWLAANGGPSAVASWQKSHAREQEFIKLLMDTRGRLNEVYTSALPEKQKLACKLTLFQDLAKDYEQLKQGWGGYAGYDKWFQVPINNARFASLATYEQWLPVFRRLYLQSEGDVGAFYLAAESLARLPRKARVKRMQQLLHEAQPAGWTDQSIQAWGVKGCATNQAGLSAG